jgi:hypothetical protein
MRALAAGALVLLVLPAAAGATDYGGGTAPDSVSHADRRLTLIAFRMADDGTGRVAVKVAAGCGMARATRTIGLAADGTFALETTARERVGGVLRQSEIMLSGQIVGPVASGSVRARVAFRREGRVVERCDSGVREWNARAPGATSGSGPAYYGLTSQTGRPFPFVLSVDNSRVRVAAFDYRLRCRRTGFEWENMTPGGPIAADGTFSLDEQFTRRWLEGRERFRVRLDGRVTASGVSGTLSVNSVLRSPGGRLLDRCATGRQTFSALP